MAATAVTVRDAATDDRAVQAWLFFVAFLIFCMIVVGGATRLTDSGLSITEWKPIMGALPPLSDHDWHDAFSKYQQIPEYHHVNRGMSLDEFKTIFWWEWSHRFLGRFIGLAFALPLAFFWITGRLRPGSARTYAGVLALGAAQGAMGWFMVMSGLVDRVDVSHYRLAAHLGLAFLIFACVLWLAFDLFYPRDGKRGAGWSRLAAAIVAVVFLQILLGALVAGLKAGLLHNTWPLMSGGFVPDDIGAMQPAWVNLFENPSTVQFNHRLVAYVVAVLVVWNVVRVMRSGASDAVKSSARGVVGAVALQIVLGIWTLLAAVPLSLGLAHQAGAAIVLAAAVRHLHDVVNAKRVVAPRPVTV